MCQAGRGEVSSDDFETMRRREKIEKSLEDLFYIAIDPQRRAQQGEKLTVEQLCMIYQTLQLKEIAENLDRIDDRLIGIQSELDELKYK